MCEAIVILVDSKVYLVCEKWVYDRKYEVIDILPFDSSYPFPSRTHNDLDIQLSSEVNSFYAQFRQVFPQIRPQIVN